MQRSASGEMLGKRPELLALAFARIFIASAVLLQARDLAISDATTLAIQSIVLGWTAIAFAGLFVNLPRTQHQFLIVLVLDWIFAGGIVLLGAPVTGVLLLLLDEVALRMSGWRRSLAIAIFPFLMMLSCLWLAEWTFSLSWVEARILPSDIVIWGGVLLAYALALHLTATRRANLERLSGDIWIDPILSSNQPFSYDFTKWIDQVAVIFGGDRCICLLALTQKPGMVRIFGNGSPERFRAELAKALSVLRHLLPQSLQVIRDRERSDQHAEDSAIKQLHVVSLLDHAVIMAKHFKLGMQDGVLIIAHNQPNDAILGQEAIIVDQALNDVVGRIYQTMEMRRAFLGEAREIARRDLHDGILQSLAALRMRLLTIIQSHRLTSVVGAEIRNTAEIIALEQARLRSLLEENVDADQPINLVEALRLCVQTTALQWEIEVEFVSNDTVIPMHRDSSNNIEYLLREVIANATRHSESKRLRCSLALRDDNLIISLMDLSATPAAFHGDFHSGPLSSQSLQQRLTLVNGRAYSDGLQTGTLLAIAIPLIYDETDL